MTKTKIGMICLAILEAVIFALGIIAADTRIAAGATPTPTAHPRPTP